MALTLATTSIDAQAGNALANTPRDSANLWTTSWLPHSVKVGCGVNYTSWVNATAADAPATAIYNRATIPGFVLHNLMGTYTVNKQMSVQVNITNLLDITWTTPSATTARTTRCARTGPP